MKKIAICVITYKRPEGLSNLLASLNQLSFNKVPRPILELVVVDNDTSGNAAQLCKAIDFPDYAAIKCVTEERRGISYARNTAIASTSADVDFIAFIDDDEIADPAWLDELLHAENIHDADVVTGCVLSHFTDEMPDWIRRGAFFDRERYVTGQSLTWARTGNVLIRKSIFDFLGMFDERFSLSGGEDTHFFMRVNLAGYKIVWSDESVVSELVPATRINAQWILKRAFRTGSNFILCCKDLYSPLEAGIWTIRGFIRISKGLLTIPFVAILGRHRIIYALQTVFNGAGIVSGMLGIKYEEYRKTHGC